MALKGGGSRRRKRLRRTKPTIATIRERNKRCGHYFFEKGAMRFFKSRVLRNVYASKGKRCLYFVTSEQGPSGGRRYTVRNQCGCNVRTVGEFQGYHSADVAKTAAKKAAAKDKR